MDAKARLVEVIGAALNDGWRHEAGRLADKVLAEFDLTPKPPAPAGPVTSEEAVRDLYPFSDAETVASRVLAAFVAGEPSPDARYRAEPLLGNRWAVTTHGVMLDICVSAEQARAVANVLNYLEAARG